MDSPVDEGGFDPVVPSRTGARLCRPNDTESNVPAAFPYHANKHRARHKRSENQIHRTRYGKFESSSLHRRVRKLSVPLCDDGPLNARADTDFGLARTVAVFGVALFDR